MKLIKTHWLLISPHLPYILLLLSCHQIQFFVFFFSIYPNSLGHCVCSHGFKCHLHADNYHMCISNLDLSQELRVSYSNIALTSSLGCIIGISNTIWSKLNRCHYPDSSSSWNTLLGNSSSCELVTIPPVTCLGQNYWSHASPWSLRRGPDEGQMCGRGMEDTRGLSRSQSRLSKSIGSLGERVSGGGVWHWSAISGWAFQEESCSSGHLFSSGLWMKKRKAGWKLHSRRGPLVVSWRWGETDSLNTLGWQLRNAQWCLFLVTLGTKFWMKVSSIVCSAQPCTWDCSVSCSWGSNQAIHGTRWPAIFLREKKNEFCLSVQFPGQNSIALLFYGKSKTKTKHTDHSGKWKAAMWIYLFLTPLSFVFCIDTM